MPEVPGGFSLFSLRSAFAALGAAVLPAEAGQSKAGSGPAGAQGEERDVFVWFVLSLQGALAEVRAYEQMALLAAAFAFAHSKWNGEAGPEQVVFKVCGVPKFQGRPALSPSPAKTINSPWWLQPLPQFSVTGCPESSQGHKPQQQRHLLRKMELRSHQGRL